MKIYLVTAVYCYENIYNIAAYRNIEDAEDHVENASNWSRENFTHYNASYTEYHEEEYSPYDDQCSNCRGYATDYYVEEMDLK